MADYKLNMRLNHRATPEIKYMRLMEAIEEVHRKFLKASKKGEIFNLSGKGQARLSSKKWKR